MNGVSTQRLVAPLVLLIAAAIPTHTLLAVEPGTADVVRLAAQAKLRGDAQRGARLFFQSAAACSKCHLADERSPLGPDLATIDPNVTDEYLVEAILYPSKAIRKGYETVQVLTDEGKVLSGMMARETETFIALRKATDLEREVKIDRDEIETVRTSDQSMMPEGLADSFRQERDLLDLLRYVMEVARGGQTRATELRPDASELVLRDDTINLDHAGILRSLDEDDLKSGQRIYRSHCVNCHGRDGNTPTLPTARAFGNQPMKFAADPYGMLQTLTRGAGLMAAMQNLSPIERYQVIHYIRESLMKESNPAYEPVTDQYLESLPEGTEWGESEESGDRDYGPVLGSQIGQTVNHAMTLRPIEGVTVSYDLHRMRLAGVWENGFLDLSQTQHYRQRGERMPQIDGEPIPGLGHWSWQLGGTYQWTEDVKPPRGPVKNEFMRFRGYYLHDDRTVLYYDIHDRGVLETVDAERPDEESNQSQARVVLNQTLRVAPGSNDIRVAIANPSELEDSKVSLSADGKSVVIRFREGAGPDREVFSNEPMHVVTGEDARKLDLGTIDRTVVARFRTTKGGTLIASAPANGRWKPDGKSLFIRGGKLVFDIGWVGAIQSKTSVNDGQWHTAVLTVDEDVTRLFIDGDLEAEREEFRRPAESSHVLKVGSTASDFGGDFQGELGFVAVLKGALSEDEVGQQDEEKSDWSEMAELLFDWEGETRKTETSTKPDRWLMAVVRGTTDATRLERDADGRVVLTIPASDKPILVQVSRLAMRSSGRVPSDKDLPLPKELEDPASFTRGGAVRWPQTLEAEGKLGESINGYALDTIPVPFENPWNAWMRTSAVDFLEDGRAVVTTHGGDVYLVSGIDESLAKVTWKRFAAGLFEPFGVRVIDNQIYVTCRDGLKRLHDFNGDDEADFVEAFWNDDDVSSMFHAYNFDLQTDAEGYFYLAKAGQYTKHHRPGTIIRIPPEGGSAEVVAWGIRTPNGMGKLPDDRMTVSDNQGPWMPAGKISLAEPGNFLGNMPINDAQEKWLKARHGGELPTTFDEPFIWMPQELDNSCGGQVWAGDSRFGPLANRLIHSSFGKGWLYYLSMEEIDDKTQASIVALPHQWDAGVMRLRVNQQDGQIYGVGLSGWQGPSGGRDGCFQRLRYTGEPMMMVDDFRVTHDGVELKFSFDVDPATARDPESYEIEMWDYLWSRVYGSEQFSLLQPGRIGRDTLMVTEVVLVAPDTVRLVIPDLQVCDQLSIEMNFRARSSETAVTSADGARFVEHLYATVHAKPAAKDAKAE
ncbi:MAG: DUF6797 domain-containing protein [Planctomycetota bacterium]